MNWWRTLVRLRRGGILGWWRALVGLRRGAILSWWRALEGLRRRCICTSSETVWTVTCRWVPGRWDSASRPGDVSRRWRHW